jgi:hypothetical protein
MACAFDSPEKAGGGQVQFNLENVFNAGARPIGNRRYSRFGNLRYEEFCHAPPRSEEVQSGHLSIFLSFAFITGILQGKLICVNL